MRRFFTAALFLLLSSFISRGQAPGLLGLPDRIMSSSRIGRVSARQSIEVPPEDTVRIDFPACGNKWVSVDYDFFKYLLENDLRQDVRTLVKGCYVPSDTLDYMRAQVLFSDRKLTQATEYFSRVPANSVFGPESFHYCVVSLASAGHYHSAASLLANPPTSYDRRPYSELFALQEAGLALLESDKDQWLRSSSAFTYSDYTLSGSEQVLSEIARDRFESGRKSAAVAALASALLPGAGKVYAGRVGEGVAAFLTVGSLGAVTAENWSRHGVRDWRTILAGSLCAAFYIGNIYGSYMSVSIENDERVKSQNAVIVYHLHLPLRSVFR